MNARSILGIAILAAVGLVAVTAMSLTMTPGDREGFGLTGDRMVLLVGEDEGIEAYRLPSGGTYADIRWSSADTSVATVDGGTVRGISLGETTVRAEISANGRTYSDECRVTVAASKTSEHRAYDVFSDARDYAVLSGDGFDSGILALTFNSLHHVVVSMPGYKDVWTTRTDGTGCVSSDFDEIRMTVKDVNGQTVVESVYENNGNPTPENGGSVRASCNEDGYTALIAVTGLDHGTYTVEFRLTRNANATFHQAYTDTVTGTFSYVRGDGDIDASGSVTRTYIWAFDGNNDMAVETHHMAVELEYRGYLSAILNNAGRIHTVNGTMRNYGTYSECGEFCQVTGNIARIADALKGAYTSAYGSTVYDDQRFAQFVLAFCQLNFDYEMDDTQYNEVIQDGQGGGTDYWAFPEETIYSGYGDCEDLSLLTATIFKALGLDAAVSVIPGHMVAAVALDGYTATTHAVKTILAKAEEDGRTYYFCECTVKGPVREVKTIGSVTTMDWICSLAIHKSGSLGVKYTYYDYGIGRISSSNDGATFEFFRI